MILYNKSKKPSNTIAKHMSPEAKTERSLRCLVSGWELLRHQLSFVSRPVRRFFKINLINNGHLSCEAYLLGCRAYMGMSCIILIGDNQNMGVIFFLSFSQLHGIPPRVPGVDVGKSAGHPVGGEARVVPLWAGVGVLAATTNLVAVKLMSRVIIFIMMMAMMALIILMGFHRPPTQSLLTHRLKTCRIRSRRCSGPCTRGLPGT